MWPMDCIAHKRDGKVLTDEEIRRFIADYTAGRIADYQAAAWLMAIYLQGMTDEETTELTLAMAKSGDIVNLSSIPGIKVDNTVRAALPTRRPSSSRPSSLPPACLSPR